jgi:hypothetical protein
VASYAAANAIENNFLTLPIHLLAAAGGSILTALKIKDIAETAADAADAYDQGGLEGLTQFVAKEGAVRVVMGRAGRAVVYVGGKAFQSAKHATQAILNLHPSLAKKAAEVGAIRRDLESQLSTALRAVPAPAQPVGAGGVSIVGPMGSGLDSQILLREAKEIGGASKPLMGEYRHVKGHHVHAKKAFEGHINYDPKKGFCISNEYMEKIGVKHERVTVAQMRLFKELRKSGRPNTIKEHTRIAVESLIEGGATREQARNLVAKSLKDLKNKGIRMPTTIPWGGK